MSIATTQMPIACPIGMSSWKSPIWVRTNSRPEAAAARSVARFQVGGWASRSARRWRAAALSDCFCASGLGLRPVRPRASIVPAAFPRCLDRRLRLVWATALGVYVVLEGAAVAQRHLEPLERRGGSEADELGARDLGMPRD